MVYLFKNFHDKNVKYYFEKIIVTLKIKQSKNLIMISCKYYNS